MPGSYGEFHEIFVSFMQFSYTAHTGLTEHKLKLFKEANIIINLPGQESTQQAMLECYLWFNLTLF